MLWKEPVCLLIIVLGTVLFLYGANSFNADVGWPGVGLFVGGIFAYIALKVYESLTKKGD
jgi:hypothetical protein